ncbi:MAG: hypothetical protein JXQ87_08045 [Bacteroidia bacterium]
MKTFLSSLVKTTFLILILFSSIVANAQKKDKEELDPEEVIARKSALRSSMLPGWGQATNGGVQWLKVPLVYGGLGTLGYLSYFNHSKFKCFETGYRLTLNDLYWEGCDGYTSVNALKNGMETYHQRRDLFIIITAGFYALNILDAYVWAHLNQFDNSDDLTLRLQPSFVNIAGQQSAGLSLKLSF